MGCPTALHKGVACGRGPERVWHGQHGPACTSLLTEPRSAVIVNKGKTTPSVARCRLVFLQEAFTGMLQHIMSLTT